MLGRDSTPDEAVLEDGADKVFRALSLSGWNAGNIISDAVFFASDTMTAAQIQSFLNARGNPCQSGYVCLKDYRQSTPTRAADRYCPSTYAGASNETAATIIAKVARACGINPQVLLVVLQKEQSLVTRSNPSADVYKIAMGYACPDTAPCDERYYGFFNQVYSAARQFKLYGMVSGFRHNAGQTADVYYHPNAGCGTSRVYIANKATAALYNYTPYQPNAAALAAGWGTGDGCSSYGNRNFYNYFTTWFGSTQGVSSGLVNVGFDVYMVSGGKRFHITPEIIEEYRAAFGAPVSVSQSYLQAFTDSGRATLFVRNAQNGHLSMVQSGQRHHFASCSLVEAWGGACGAATPMDAADYVRIAEGPAMGLFAVDPSGARMYRMEGDMLRWLASPSAARAINGGAMPYAARMSSSTFARYELGPTIFMPGAFVKPAAENRVYLPTIDGRLLYLPAWVISDEGGFVRHLYDNVAQGDLARFTKDGELSSFVRCANETYFGAAGALRPVADEAVRGFTTTNLDAALCRAATVSSEEEIAPLFVAARGQDPVYFADSGQFRHVAGPEVLKRLAGGATPTVLGVSPQLIDLLPLGDVIR